ncbi:hypothetical protein [Komagataeibacter diospyri]|nr:hypothetical protein [Komagataeibacter diospyri]
MAEFTAVPVIPAIENDAGGYCQIPVSLPVSCMNLHEPGRNMMRKAPE